MLTDEQRHAAAQSIMQSHQTKVQNPGPWATYPNMEIEDSYAISSMIVEQKVAQGNKIVGHKIGLTSKAMQAASKVNEPDYGYITDDLLLQDGAEVSFDDYCVPRVEPELTFILKEPLQGPGIGLVDVMRATEWVVPSIEIIDARVKEPRRIFDMVADNGAYAGLVMGGRPVRPEDVDLRWVGAIFYRNAGIEETGLAAGVLGHPAMAIAWLANKLGPHGTALEPGHMVLSGSFTRPVWAAKGDTLHADFGPLGGVSVRFV
jgi:2-oxo-hept-3-ene-1,7-dioate hydratase